MFDYQGVHGPDVSYYQDDPETVRQIDFAQMKAAGASFVIIRCSQNVWVDPDFSYNIVEAKRTGLPVGVYAFHDSRATPESQADLVLSLTKGLSLDLGVWLDLEERYQGKYSGPQNWKKFLSRLKANTPKVGIYTAPSYWTEHIKYMTATDLAYFKTFPLWIANYDVLQPAIPAPWSNAILWQIGTPDVGLQYGAESLEIDMNYWNGDIDAFKAFFGLGYQPEQTGVAMRYKAVNLFDNMRLRSGSNTASLAIGTYTHGQVFEGDNLFVATVSLSNSAGVYQAVGDNWLEVKSVNGVPKSGWVAVVHLGKEYCTLTDNTPTVPPSEEYILHVKDGVTRKFVLSNE